MATRPLSVKVSLIVDGYFRFLLDEHYTHSSGFNSHCSLSCGRYRFLFSQNRKLQPIIGNLLMAGHLVYVVSSLSSEREGRCAACAKVKILNNVRNVCRCVCVCLGIAGD